MIKRVGGNASRILPDYAFQTELMMDLKWQDGLTRGRGMDEVTRMVWIKSAHVCSMLHIKMKKLLA